MEAVIRKYILFLCTLFIVLETRGEYLQCRTPFGAIGKCKPISYCESLHTLALKAPLTQKDINLLIRSKCGEINKNILVCCPVQSDYLPEVTQKPAEKVLEICATPFGGNGHCINKKDCPIFNMLKFTEKEERLLINSKCGGINSGNICCPQQIPARTTPTLIKPLRNNSTVETCKTPRGENGYCENIYNCPTLFNILSKQEFAANDRTFLIKSICGNSEMFCCPEQSVTQPNSLKPSSDAVDPQLKKCQTPAGKQGDCKPIRECPPLFSLLARYTEMDQIQLTKSKCGENEGVCCPTETSPPQPPYKTLTRTLVFPESQCQTTNGLSGICKFRKDCGLINTRISDNSRENNDCGSVNGELQICCPVKMIGNDLQFPIPATTTTSVPITTPPTRIPTFPENFCKTPLQENGTCVSIMECDSLRRLETKQPRTYMENMYLEKSICANYAERKVCCPISEARQRTTTTSTQRPTPAIPITNRPTTAEPKSTPPTPEGGGQWINDPKCGRIAPENRIYGGRIASIDEFPWTARLIYISNDNDVDYSCGGSLINKDFVLTAAHCVHKSNVESKWFFKGVRLGEWNTTTDVDCDIDCAPPHSDIDCPEIIIHDKYNPNTYKNDIALLRLEKSVAPTKFIQPVCLPSKSSQTRNYQNEEVEVAGWGKTETSEHSEVKMKATLRVLNSTICDTKFRKSVNVICAQGDKGSDSCGGDSGGPLMYKDKKNLKIYLIGVVSSGTGEKCGAANTIGVYTNVSAHMDWIVKKTA
uniref:Serine protease easter n=1 Tax=Ceratitis capitata TaxID=7213 RepID=W8B3Y1_CERCA